jgi:hypothetical protein
MHKDTQFWLDKGNSILSSLFPIDFGQIICEYRKGVLGSEYIYFLVSPCDRTINNVNLQYPDFVGLSLELNKMELQVAKTVGNIANSIAVKTDNKFVSYDNIVIPFRKVKPDKEKILNAIKRFFEKYIAATKENSNNLHYLNFYTESARQFFNLPLYNTRLTYDGNYVVVTGGKELLTYLSILYVEPISTLFDNSIAMVLPKSYTDKVIQSCEYFYSVGQA